MVLVRDLLHDGCVHYLRCVELIMFIRCGGSSVVEDIE